MTIWLAKDSTHQHILTHIYRTETHTSRHECVCLCECGRHMRSSHLPIFPCIIHHFHWENVSHHILLAMNEKFPSKLCKYLHYWTCHFGYVFIFIVGWLVSSVLFRTIECHALNLSVCLFLSLSPFLCLLLIQNKHLCPYTTTFSQHIERAIVVKRKNWRSTAEYHEW